MFFRQNLFWISILSAVLPEDTEFEVLHFDILTVFMPDHRNIVSSKAPPLEWLCTYLCCLFHFVRLNPGVARKRICCVRQRHLHGLFI